MGRAPGNAGEAAAQLLREAHRVDLHAGFSTPGAAAGVHRGATRGHGIEFDEVREYVVGDDPRTVDWNVSARAGRPFVKRFVEERELTVVLALDLSPTLVESGFGRWSPRQLAARIAAHLALAAARSGDQIGLIGFGGPPEHNAFVRPSKGMAQALRLVRDVLAWPTGAEPDGSTALAHGFDVLATNARLGRRCAAYVLSDWVAVASSDTDPVDLIRAAQRASVRHDITAVRIETGEFLLDDRSMRELGSVRVRCGSSHRLLPWQHAAHRASYRDAISAWRCRVDRVLARAGVDSMLLQLAAGEHDPGVVGRSLRRFLERRSRRRHR